MQNPTSVKKQGQSKEGEKQKEKGKKKRFSAPFSAFQDFPTARQTERKKKEKESYVQGKRKKKIYSHSLYNSGLYIIYFLLQIN